jgi:hypothetical protein
LSAARLSLARERRDDFQMWRPRELIDGNDTVKAIAAVDQYAGIAGEACGVA